MARALRENKEYHEQELVIERPDGSRRIALAHASPFFDEFGRVVGAVNILVDVTERRQSDEAFQQSEECFRAIFKQASAGIAQTDSTGRFTLVNDLYCDITGYSRAELLRMRKQDIIHPDDLPHALKQLQRLWAGGVNFDIEKRYIRKDGSHIWVHNSVCAIRDAAGRVQSFVTIALDVTEQKQAKQALAADERVLQLIVSGAPLSEALDTLMRETEAQSRDGMLGSILLIDDSGQKLRHGAAPGLPQEYNRAVDGIAIGPKVGSCGTAAFLRKPVFVHDIARDPLWADFKDLASRYGLGACCSTPIFCSAGRLLGTIAMYYRRPHEPSEHDRQLVEHAAQLAGIIIERKQAEEALREADRKKDEFLATLAHELRNPLASLRNGLLLVKLADHDAIDVEQARNMMERQLGQLVRLVDDLLDVSRISRGKIVLRKEQIVLSDVVRMALETCAPFIEQCGHELTVTLPDESVYLDADKTRLAQIVCNLLNNAAKYTDNGGRIWLTGQRQGSEVTLSVRDTGIGIPAEMLPKVFDLFTQVDQSLEKSHGGLGIGLTLVKQLVEMHGGRIEAKSDGPGSGSEFVVRLPMLPAPLGSQPAERDGISAGPTARRRILIVDDNVDAANSLALLLQIMGNEVRTAHDGVEGVDAAAAFRPDLALVDVGMPKLNGYEACRRIRQQPWGRGIVLVALTGWGQGEDKRRSQDAGFDAHMVKPVDLGALEKLLRETQLMPA